MPDIQYMIYSALCTENMPRHLPCIKCLPAFRPDQTVIDPITYAVHPFTDHQDPCLPEDHLAVIVRIDGDRILFAPVKPFAAADLNIGIHIEIGSDQAFVMTDHRNILGRHRDAELPASREADAPGKPHEAGDLSDRAAFFLRRDPRQFIFRF